LQAFFQRTTPEQNAVPGAVIANQSFGDILGFNSCLHVLASDDCFYGNGMFRIPPRFHAKDVEKIFRHKVFKMLLSKCKIPENLVDLFIKWQNSRFNVFRGPWIQSGDEEAIENLSPYVIPAVFSQERMPYIPEWVKAG